ncbi:MAG: hypothetical protein RLP09_12810 [Sandaracinaceae bacterium]
MSAARIALALLLTSGCSTTMTVVALDAEPDNRANGRAIAVTVRDGDGRVVRAPADLVAVDAEDSWPVRVGIVPGGTSRYTLAAELLDDEGRVLSRVQTAGALTPGRVVEVRLVFEDAVLPREECAAELVDGLDDLPAPVALGLPPLRTRFVDPAFGTCVARVTDASDGADGPHPPAWIRHETALRDPYSADGAWALTRADDGWWHLYAVPSWSHAREIDLQMDEPVWSPSDPDRLRYLLHEGRDAQLRQYDVRTNRDELLADLLPELRAVWPAAARGWTRERGEPSRDGAIWTWQVEDVTFGPLGVAVFDLDRPDGARLLGTLDTTERPRMVTSSPSGRFAVVAWEDATHAYPVDRDAGSVDFDGGRLLLEGAESSDLALDAAGDDVFVVFDYTAGALSSVDLATGTRTPLLSLYPGPGTSIRGDVSGVAYDAPGWVLVSIAGCARDGGPCRPGDAAADDLLAFVELRRDGRVLPLAYMRASGADYDAEPRATLSRDATRVLFASAWGGDVVASYEIYLPAGVLPEALP